MTSTIDGSVGGTSSFLLSYDDFDEALRNAYFNPSQAGLPVYLDLDDQVLSAAAQTLGLDVSGLTAGLVTAVRRRLRLRRSAGTVFSQFDASLALWRTRFIRARRNGDSLPAPPIVGLLAVFTMAAEQMGDRKNSEIHDAAYYPRLFNILNVPQSEKGRFQADFQKHSESYWSSLRDWLEAQDGDFGLPTAYALSHRYIGLPISQALIREAERKELQRIFEEMGLISGATISYGDMEAAIDQWVTAPRSPASRNLVAMWNGARNRVVEIALVEYDNWDGVARYARASSHMGGSDGGELRSVRLVVSEEFDFFNSHYSFGALIPHDAEVRPLHLLTAEGATTISSYQAGPAVDIVPFDASGIDTGSALDGLLRLQAGDATPVIRFPREAIPFIWDSNLNVFIESERVPAGERSALLVRDDGVLISQAVKVLGSCARPGFVEVKGSDQHVPEGWSLFTNVQIVESPAPGTIPPSSPLEVLTPRLTMQMSLTGGFRLPGRIQRWSSLALPELMVVADDAVELRLDVRTQTLDGDLRAPQRLAAGQAPLIVRLSDHIEEVANYTIYLYRGNSLIQTVTLRVRDSSEPDQASWARISNVAHYDVDPLWPLRARSGGSGTAIVDGAISVGESVIVTPTREVAAAQWGKSEGATGRHRKLAIVDAPSATSCIQTGAHRWDIPRDDPKSKARFTIGKCRDCGMVRRYPTKHWDPVLRKKEASARVAVATKKKMPVREGATDWRAAIDALFWMGSGTANELSSVARQIENSALFEDFFVRSLESLGIIETTRDSRLAVTGFEVAATAYAELANGNALLAGCWRLGAADELPGAQTILNADTVKSVTLVARDWRAVVEDADVPVADMAGFRMLETLPHISSVVAALPQVPNPLVPNSTEVFSPPDNKWYPYRSAMGTGAFRKKGFGSAEYYIRVGHDVNEDVVRRVTMDVAKYLSSWLNGVSLIRYDTNSETLRVPIGAPLPGLYERAAVLMSGRLPVRARDSWSLEYGSISPEFAAALEDRLS